MAVQEIAKKVEHSEGPTGPSAPRHPRWVGFDVSGRQVTLVDMTIPPSGPAVIEADMTWPLQEGARSAAYRVMHETVSGYLTDHHIAFVVVKGSAVSGGAATMKLLRGAELRGVVVAAAASTTAKVIVSSKADASKNSSRGKVDKYVKDKSYWAEKTTGKLRAGSKVAAYLVLAGSRGEITDDGADENAEDSDD